MRVEEIAHGAEHQLALLTHAHHAILVPENRSFRILNWYRAITKVIPVQLERYLTLFLLLIFLEFFL